MPDAAAAQQNGSGLLSFGAFARARGLTQQRVSQLVAAGRIPVVFLVPGDPRSRRINPPVANAALDALRDPSQVQKAKGAAESGDCRPAIGANAVPNASNNASGRQGASAPERPAVGSGAPGAGLGVEGSFAAARTRTETTRERLLEVQLRERVGELVEVEAVEKAVFDTNMAIAKTLDTMPDRLAGVLAAESDPRRVRERLVAEVKRIREDVATAAATLAANPVKAAL